MRSRLTAIALLGVAFVVGSCIGVPPSEPSRVVAIGDVHGAYDALLRILSAAGLVDTAGHWRGGTATLVQVGDLIDRGPDDRRVLELMMALEEEAARDRGRVVVILGNHEVMNLHGDLRYVARAAFESFAAPNSQARLEAAYEAYLQLEPLDTEASTETWQSFLARHPVGYLEHREAFGPKGRIGKWLRKRQALVKIGDVVFAHGGIHPDVAERRLRPINDQAKTELAAFDAARDYLVRRRRILPSADLDQITAAARFELEASPSIPAGDRVRLEMLTDYASWMVVHPNAPLWFRGFAEWSDEEAEKHVPGLLEAFDAKHFVVGHTPQLGGGIRSRLDGKLYLIDTGILDGSFYPGGVQQALEIVDGRFRVIDVRRRRAAVPARASDEVGG